MATHSLDLPASQQLWSSPSLLRWNFKDGAAKERAAEIHNWEQSELEPRCSHGSLLCVWECFSRYFLTAAEFIWRIDTLKTVPFARTRWCWAEAGGFQYTKPLCSRSAAATVANCWAKRSLRTRFYLICNTFILQTTSRVRALSTLAQTYCDENNKACLLNVTAQNTVSHL